MTPTGSPMGRGAFNTDSPNIGGNVHTGYDS
jgi:hypothetical protein